MEKIFFVSFLPIKLLSKTIHFKFSYLQFHGFFCAVLCVEEYMSEYRSLKCFFKTNFYAYQQKSVL